MIFPGRMLASGDGITFWQSFSAPGYELHLVDRGIVLHLSPAELAALARLASAAAEASRIAEDPADHSRRLQILQARVTDYLRRERTPAPEAPGSPTDAAP